MMNKETAINLFDRNSCLIRKNDVIPEDIAEKITSKEAVEFAKKMNRTGYNGYGIGDYTLLYLARETFLLAVTYQNIDECRKAGIAHETN